MSRFFKRKRTRVLVIIVVALLVTALVLRLSAARYLREVEARYPAPGRFVEAEGVRLHYVAKGEGPPVVFIHGSMGSVYDFTFSVFDRVAQNHFAVALDRPGHGHSPRPPGARSLSPADHARYVRAALKSLKVERPVLVGYSWGAAVALAYAEEFPEETAGFVLIGPVAFAEESAWPSRYLIAEVPVVGPAFMSLGYVHVTRLAGEEMMRGVFWPDPVPREFSEAALALMARPEVFEAEAADTLGLDEHLKAMAARYGELRAPTVIINGEQDQRTLLAVQARPLHEAIRHSTLVVVPNSGHAVHFAHPEAVLDAIRLVEEQARAGAPRDE